MEKFKFAVPCLFGLESFVSDEIKRMGYEALSENGRVFFTGDSLAILKTNIGIRYGERVLLVIGEFDAYSFEELFEGTKALPWENFIPKDGKFPVKGYSLNSKLHSVPDCQSIIKKAIVERLKIPYKVSIFEETGALYQVSFSLMKDKVTMMIDTTGEGLHKRGYRKNANDAPLRETLAAAMVKLSKFRYSDYLLDPLCGSGTILIEAAMLATDRAPGLYRNFSFEGWENLLKANKISDAREEATSKIRPGNFKVYGKDIAYKNVALTAENAKKAGVGELVNVTLGDATKIKPLSERGMIITNPPYGERLLDQKLARELYEQMGENFRNFTDFKFFILSSEII